MKKLCNSGIGRGAVFFLAIQMILVTLYSQKILSGSSPDKKIVGKFFI
jgi:hypothetical protein